MKVIVMGMHRSGTSLVTKIVNELGIRVENTMNKHFWYDFMEDTLIYQIDQSLTGNNDFVEHRGRNKPKEELILQLKQKYKDNFAFKTLLGCLNLDFWNKQFPDAKIIFCIRHPAEVAANLEEHNKIKFEDGLRKWLVFNLAFLTDVKKDYLLIDFEDMQTDFDNTVRKIADFLNLKYKDISHIHQKEKSKHFGLRKAVFPYGLIYDIIRGKL